MMAQWIALVIALTWERRRMTTVVNVAQLAAQIAGMIVVFAVTLFLPAGTLGWPAAWAFLALFFGFVVALTAWLLRFNPGLLVERMTGVGKSDQKRWDKLFLALTGVAFFAWLAVMGLDAVRFQSSQMPSWLQAIGALVLLSSFWLFFVTFRENTFLSPAVRVQKERAQTVVSTGPYRYVRHPMYAGFVLFACGTAFLLGSWYGVLGALLLTTMIARRAVLEERVLREELAGYGAYMTHVRYRLLPRVW
jgi:protein-S-isoprenylcysteine O-methyltransferase Ste14